MAKAKPKQAENSGTTPEQAFLATAEPADDGTAGDASGNDDGLLDTKPKSSGGFNVPPKVVLERHPLSEKYGPPTSDEEIAGMAADIKAHGQHEAIKLFEGKVIAGWTRYQGCVRAGVVPRTEEYTGDQAEAVAFGTNVVRRQLTSISKAFMGAQFYLSNPGKHRQADVAKQCSVSLNRLSQCIQLLRLDSDEAKAAQTVLRTNPAVTATQFDEMLLENGINRTASKPAADSAPVKNGSRLGDDEGDIDDLGDLSEMDLLGGAIDSQLDDDDDPADEGDGADGDAKKTARKPIGEGAQPVGPVGSSPASREALRPTETAVSKLSKFFNALSPNERVQFVSFSWKHLRNALSQAITEGKVVYELPADMPAPKAKGADYVAEVKASKPAKPAKPASPAQLAAREKLANAAKAKKAERDAAKAGNGEAPAEGAASADEADDDLLAGKATQPKGKKRKVEAAEQAEAAE